jgi:TolB-like protein
MKPVATSARFTTALALIAVAAACTRVPPTGNALRDLRAAEEYARVMVQMESSIRADSIPPRSVGVTPLRLEGADPSLAALGYGLADFIMADLARSSQLTVVNRLRFDAVLRELQLASTGRIDSATAPRVGKLIGAGRLITGSIGARPGDNLGIGAQVVNTTTGAARVAVVATTTLNQILSAQKELTFRIFTELGVTLTPAERASIEPFHTQNVAALMAYSRGVQYETEARFGSAAREFRRAAQLDPAFTLASTRAVEAQSLSASLPLSRALAFSGDNINRSLFNPSRLEFRGAADPSFGLQSVTIRISITTPP